MGARYDLGHCYFGLGMETGNRPLPPGKRPLATPLRLRLGVDHRFPNEGTRNLHGLSVPSRVIPASLMT